MYGLTDTTEGMFETFRRIEEGKATSKDYASVRTHIEAKKVSIRQARQERNMDGYKGKPKARDPVTINPMFLALNQGRQIKKNLENEFGIFE
mgnify:CR=1 FL=1|jgi:hypothetical protein|tara:strand:- start:153 stop:428 length:276 start_codon:yes stop_codon:yes gene_type:complete